MINIVRHLTGALLLLFIAAPSAPAASSSLRMVCDEWPPYQIVRDGNVSGFSVELITAALASMDVAPGPIDAFPWKRAIHILRSGRADALFSANFSEDRLRFARYPSEPLVESSWVIWVHRKAEFSYEEMADLRGKRIGVVSGYSYTPSFWQFIRKRAAVDPVTKDETNFRKLSAGRLDCIVAELGNGLFIRRSLGLDNLTPLRDHPIKVDGLYLIFQRDRVSEETVARFSNALKKFKESPAHSGLRQKYFGAP
ncbi:MAG: substrate-binding periplasmic protein [Desulfococcaceae bacterium]